MRSALSIIAITLSMLTAGCAPVKVQAPAAKAEPHAFKPIEFRYNEKLPEASNFARQLDIPIFQCELEAGTGRYAVRYNNRQGVAEYTQSGLECDRHARAEADAAVARLKSAKVGEKQADLAKTLYAKWSAYLATISLYSPADARAKAEYQAAKESLAAEVKFSQ